MIQASKASQVFSQLEIAKLPGLNQPLGFAYIIAVMSHLGVEVPNHQIKMMFWPKSPN